MKRIKLLTLLALFPFFAAAQVIRSNSDFGEIYRLTADEARQAYLKKKDFDAAWLHTLVGTNDTLGMERLPPGHYLLMMAGEEGMIAQVMSYFAFNVDVIDTHRDFAFVLHDTTGRLITDAQATLHGKKVPFDTKMQCYRLKKRKKGGVLEISFAGNTWFYSITPKEEGQSIRRQRWHRFAITPVGQIVARPYFFVWQMGRIIRYPRQAKWYFRNLKYRREGKINNRRHFGGYVAFSQPKYRPGDTLELKAWIETEKGKAWQKPLEMQMFNSRSNKNIRQITLSPKEPGHFVFTMPLGDSLAIDQYLMFRFAEKNPRKMGFFRRFQPDSRMMSAQVYYEDYVLDEVKYSFTQDKTTYLPGDSVQFHITARDGNNQPIPDGHYKLVMTTTSNELFYAPEVLLPDTLWQQEGDIPFSGNLDITVPDRFFPAGKYTLAANLYCTNSGGELQEKNLNLTIDRKKPLLEAAIDHGMFTVKWTDPSAPHPPVTIKEYENYADSQPYTVELPYKARVRPEVYSYAIVAGNEGFQLELNSSEKAVHSIAAQSFRVKDTVIFILRNPHQIPVQYRIFRGKSVFEEGVLNDSIWQKVIPDPGGNDFDFHHAFIWGGQSHDDNSIVNYFSKMLDVQVEQPQKVMPGETVQVKVKVTDSGNKPVRSADLTSGGINTLFKENPYKTPEITEKVKPMPLVYRDFEVEAFDFQRFNAPLNEQWYSRLRLDKNPYYEIRHLKAPGDAQVPAVRAIVTPIKPYAFRDENGHPVTYPEQDGRLPDITSPKDSFYSNRPQFAPYIMVNYQSQPIHLIWVNEKLVYYYNTNDKQPYSFYGNYGYNRIKIRTQDGEYTLDSVFFDKKQKYTLAFYGENWTYNPQKLVTTNDAPTVLQHARIKWEARPDTLTPFEQNYLRQSMLPLRPTRDHRGQIFVWQSDDNIHRIIDGPLSSHILGPFPPGTSLKAIYTDAFFTEFNFEPGYDFELLPGKERLYSSKAWWMPVKLPKYLPVKPMNEWAVGPHHVVSNSQKTVQYPFINSGAMKKGTGKLKITFAQKGTAVLGYAIKGNTLKGPYRSYTNDFFGLDAGRYTIYVFTTNGNVASREVTIRRDTLTYVDLSGLPFQKAAKNETFDTLFPPVLISPVWGERTVTRTAPIPEGYPNWQYGAIVEGIIKDETGEVTIGASVKLMSGLLMIKGGVTDFDGHYSLTNIPPGIYNVVVSYTGYGSESVQGVVVKEGKIHFVDVSMHAAQLLQEVMISAQGVSVQRDMTSRVLTSEVIRNLPTRSVNAITGRVAGVASIDGNAVSLKGSRSIDTNYYIDGIRVNGSMPVSEPEPAAALPPPRSNFKDHAFFRSDLKTDNKGEAVFQVTFPDNITGWNTYAIAAGGKGHFGVGNAFTQSFKPLTAQLAVPRFAVAGDYFDVAARVSNYTGDTLALLARFKVNGQVTSEQNTRLGAGWSAFAKVEVPESRTDSVTVAFEAESGRINDGELRKIPVVATGIEETTGQYLFLNSDTSLLFTPNPNLGPVTFYAQNSVLDLLLSDVDYLRTYPYWCNEQTASRLTALLVLKTIRDKQKQPFLYGKDIYICLKRLKSTQLPNGSWGWWSDGTMNIWMTIYVARAMQRAREAGYQTPGLDQALALLQLEMPAMYYTDQQDALALLRTCKVNIDCRPYLARYDSLGKRMAVNGLTRRLNYLKMLQLCGAPIAKDSLLLYMHRTTLGGMYCGLESTNWHDRRAVNTLLAFDIAAAAGWDDITSAIRQYWLESRNEQRNTIETARIMEALLPTVLQAMDNNSPNTVTVGQQRFDKFPVKITMDARNGQSVSISKTGATPVFANIYQQWHNPSPAPKSDIFEVKTQLETAAGAPTTTLKYGEAAILVVTVKVKSAAEYVMIDVPVPAGCGYGPKIQSYNPEVHREYFKDRTAVFCEQLNVGEYVFRIPLESRFTGQFTLNPAKVEQMYFPVFYGRNEAKTVKIVR